MTRLLLRVQTTEDDPFLALALKKCGGKNERERTNFITTISGLLIHKMKDKLSKVAERNMMSCLIYDSKSDLWFQI